MNLQIPLVIDMSDDESKSSNVADIANAVAAVAKEIPVYQDALQPAAQEIGKALGTVAKLVNVALAPVSVLVWGYDQIREFTATKVAEKLRDIPTENIITPKPNIAVPAIEALRYTGHEPSLSEMYANLLATAMNKETANQAHPSFVEIIKQITPDEAKIVNLFTDPNRLYPLLHIRQEYKQGNAEGLQGGYDIIPIFTDLGEVAQCEVQSNVPAYIVNLCRLGLCEIPPMNKYTDVDVYSKLKSSPILEALKLSTEQNGLVYVEKEMRLSITPFGHQFAQACTSVASGRAN